MIEDDLAQADLIKGMLAESRRREFAIRHVQYLADGLRLLGEESFDCVLVDLGLPDSRGIETALSVREASKQVPIVVLTVLDDEDAAYKSLQMDIQDYLVKNEISGAMLTRTIIHAVERKRLAMELRESEQRFAAFMSHLPAASWIKDLDGRYHYANREAIRIFARPLQEVVGKRDDELFPPETARQFRENDQRVLAGEGMLTTEELRREDGVEHASLVSKFALRDAEGETAYVAGVGFDVTELRRVQEDLRESKERLEELTKLLDYAPVLIRDTRDEILVWNRGMEAMYGFTKQEAEGKISHQLLQTVFPQPLEEMEEILESRGEWRGELRHSRRDGSVITVASLWVLDKAAPGRRVVIEVNNDITDRKNAEDALRTSEEKFSKIFETTPTLIVLSTVREGTVLDANRAALDRLGYRRDELIGRNSEELELWDDRPLRAKIVQELENGHQVHDYELGFRCRTGEIVIGLLSADFVEVNGKRCLLTLVKDVTERKQAEEAIMRSKEEWERTFDSVPDLIAVLDSQHRVLRVNRAIAQRLGRDPKECIGLPCHQIVHGTGMPVQFCPHVHTQSDAKEHRAEIYEPGLGAHFLVTTTPLTAPDGKMIGVVHVARDITESKQAEEKIKMLNDELAQRASELEAANTRLATDLDAVARLQRLAALLVTEANMEQMLGEVVDTAMAICGADFGNLQMRNEESGELEIVAQRGFPQWWIAFWNNVHQGRGACGTALDRGGRVVVEDVEQSPIFLATESLEIQRKAGVRAVQCTPLLTRSGRVVGMFSTHHRVPHRPGERELRLLDLLARNVADFIERAELRQMLSARAAQLEDANKELETFNYTAAHDLRQPLNLINGYTQAVEMLCGEKLNAECLGYLQETYAAVDRMNRLIEALLKYSRLGRIDVDTKEVDLSKMAQAVAEELRKADPEREVSFRTAEGITVNGDENLLRMVLENLIGNAWKYTSIREGIAAELEFGATNVDGKTAFFVRDNGAGFDMAEAGNLFAPFKRLSGTTDLRGFGIGLATVERIIQRHGGKVWARGERGKGATFYFTLE
jgi:PAS domain S-box-containing protein